MRIRGVLNDDTGVIIDGTNNVELYSVDQTATAVATTSSDASGLWAFDHATQGRFDVKIINGTDIVWIRGRDEFQVTTIQARNPTTGNAALHAMSTVPIATDTASLVATYGFRPSQESSGVETPDTPTDGLSGYIDYELSNDHADKQQWIAGRFAWEGVDVSDGSEDSKLNWWTMVAGTLTEELHLDNTALWPETAAGLDLGKTGLGFNDLWFESGGIIDYAAGDVTWTHAAGKLTLGGDGAVEIDFANHEMTNVDINSGAIDGTTIGAASVAAGSFAAVVGTTGAFSDVVTVGAGTAGAPSLSFAADPDTGFWRDTANQINVSIQGSERFHFGPIYFGSSTSAGARITASTNASTTVPTLMPQTEDLNTGIGWDNPDGLVLIAGGLQGLTVQETASAITVTVAGTLDLVNNTLLNVGAAGNDWTATKLATTTGASAVAEAVSVSSAGGKFSIRKGGTVTLADDASSTLQTSVDAPDVCGIIMIRNDSDNDGALFTFAGASVTLLQADANGTWIASDTDTNNCVFVTGGNLVLRNRVGGEKGYRFTVLAET